MTIISGRDKEDVKKRVGLSGVYYAGSHGFEIEDPLGRIHAFAERDRKSTRLNSSHVAISYAVFCLKKKNAQPRSGSSSSAERHSSAMTPPTRRSLPWRWSTS